jgi:hypothetical protein
MDQFKPIHGRTDGRHDRLRSHYADSVSRHSADCVDRELRVAVRAKKVDATQKEVVKTLQALHVHVESTASIGRGIPDLLCSYRGRWHVIEVKNGLLGWKFTAAQKDFRKKAHADVVILTCADDAIAWVSRLNKVHEEFPVEHFGTVKEVRA